MKRERFTCNWKGCGKSYVYTAWYSKHIDKTHPEIGNAPFYIFTVVTSADLLRSIDEETRSFLNDPK